ncbi:MAG: hypothetical protein AAF657_10995 [Acidobacteriota bacterium]
MGGVNLARRPFVNRRPVLRLAILLWLVGTILLFVNLRLFGRHAQGSEEYRQRLADVDLEVGEARAKLIELDPELDAISVKQRNGQTKFLNDVIEYRRFPWSALFDDLEEVLPLGVRLSSVKPAVRLVADEPTPSRRRTRRQTTSRRRQARAAQEAQAAQATPQPAAEARRNEVRLKLSGVARTEEDLLNFIDNLYASSSFRNPFLPGDSENDGQFGFSIDVLYLTRTSQAVEEEPPAPDGAEDSAAGALAAVSEGEGAPTLVEGEEGAEATDDPPSQPPTEVASQSSRPASAAASTEDGAEAAPATETGRRPALPGRGSTTRRPRPTERRGATSAPRPGASVSLPGAAVPGSGASGAGEPRVIGGAVPAQGAVEPGTETGTGGPEPPPASEPPGVVTPPASATPTLRRGSLLGAPPIVPMTTWGVLA